MKRLPDAPVCERGNDLISFLYGEIDERTARDFEQDFERHLLNCAECESELSAFKQVRSSVVAWRQVTLGGATADSISVAPVVNSASQPTKPSAIAAIRGFFEISPLWLKGAVAFASIVLCLVSAIALSHLFEKPNPVVAGEEKRYTAKELQAKIEDAVKSERQNRAAQSSLLPSSTAVHNTQRDKVQRRVPLQSIARVATNPKGRRGPLTKSEREQLAADLRLIIPQDDTDLELLGEGNNQ